MLTKRIVEWVGGLVLFLALIPLLIGIACFIICEAGFPFYFIATRMGHNGRQIKVFKFRTMVLNAGNEPVADSSDPRITGPVGRRLRETKLDELPQILNVLVGNMALVGPRPLPWEHCMVYRNTIANFMERHDVRPGITGLFQTLGLTYESMGVGRAVNLDRWYIRHKCLKWDLKILYQTFLLVLKRLTKPQNQII